MNILMQFQGVNHPGASTANSLKIPKTFLLHTTLVYAIKNQQKENAMTYEEYVEFVKHLMYQRMCDSTFWPDESKKAEYKCI